MEKAIKRLIMIGDDIFELKNQKTSINKLAGELKKKQDDRYYYFNSGFIICCIMDLDGKIQHVNPEFAKMSGYHEKEIEGKLLHEFTHPDDMEILSSAIVSLQNDNKVKIFEARYRCKDGSDRWIEWHIKNDLAKIYAAAHDISQQKKIEAQVLQLSQVVEQSPLSVMVTDTEGNIRYVNPRFTQLTGFTPEEVIGKNPRILKSGEQTDDVYKNLWETITLGNTWRGEFHNKKKSGELFWEATSISPMLNNNGIITHFLAIKEDITLHKTMDMEAERSRAELKAIYDTAPVMLAVIDRKRNLLYANPSFTSFTGVPEVELRGGRACGVFGCINSVENPLGCGFGSKCKSCDLLHSIEDTFTTGYAHKDIEYNTTFILGGKLKEISLLGTTAPINFAGESLLLLSFIDISDRKKAESEIKAQNILLNELNAQKDKFFSIIAHDLKSPFNAILGFSEILVEQIREKDFKGIEEYAQIIHKSSEQALNLLMNLMEWSRSQTGRMNFNPEHLDLTEFIHEIILLFDDLARQKGILIKKQLPPTIPIYVDRAMIHTVMRNLISNAIKFTKQGGEIIVSATEGKGELIVTIKDNGIGIPKARIDKLFRIDENSSTPGTANEKGTGLGLILCREFIEKHGGIIWAESFENAGSLFSFAVPLK